MSKELILIDLETVRIKRFDGLNVIVQVLVDKAAGTYRNPGTGEVFEKPDRKEWVDHGYFSNTKSALRHIYNNDLLANDAELTLAEYIDRDRQIAEKLKGFLG